MFIDHLIDKVRALDAPVCIGLDPTLALMPEDFLRARGLDRNATDPVGCSEALFAYCSEILEAVGDQVAVVKPQSAYFEVYGSSGARALERTQSAARERGLLVILDAKRGDIGSTSDAYARAYLAGEPKRAWEADALTVSPYLGEDSLEPFFRVAEQWGKGVLVCARTSNPGAAALQDLVWGDRQVHEIVADWLTPWVGRSRGSSGYSGLGIVVGATVKEQARRLRQRLPQSLFLVPGFGAQGGSLETIRACFNADGLGALINVSRTAIYPNLYQPGCRGGVLAIRETVGGLIEEIRAGLS